MPTLSERTVKKVLPISLLVFFIILVNLIMIYRYTPVGQPDFDNPPNKPKSPSPYDPPHYGLKLVRPKERKFTSEILENHLLSLESTMKDKDLYILLQNCLPNTLDTTVDWFNGNKKDPRTFLITGDIPAM
ncbi:unnamed protein product [Mucor hiemalis]